MARPRNTSDVQPTAKEVYGVVRDLLDLCVLLLTEEMRGMTTAASSDRGVFWRIRDELLYAKKVIPAPEKAVVPETNMARVAARLRLDFEALCCFAAAEFASESRDRTLAEELLKACDREAPELAIEREHVTRAIEETRARSRQRLQEWERPDTDWLKGSDERGSILMTAGDLLGEVLFNASGERPSQSASRKQLLDIIAADAAELTRMVSESERLGLVLATLGTPLAEIPWAGEQVLRLIRRSRQAERDRRIAEGEVQLVEEPVLPLAASERERTYAVTAAHLAADGMTNPDRIWGSSRLLTDRFVIAPGQFAGRAVSAGAAWGPPRNPWARAEPARRGADEDE